jgi:NADH-quinone oxidoreductase subunit J
MISLAVIDWHSCFFILFAALAVAFAIAVVATSNVVRMAFYLTLCLGSTAGLFFLAGAEFVGAMQFMIYVGGTLVLLIFGVMLTAHGNFISLRTPAGELVLGCIVGSALFALLLATSLSVRDWKTARVDRASLSAADIETTGALGMSLVGVRVDKLDQPNLRLQGGYSGYLLPFVIVSVHLLVVLVGAAYMARTRQNGQGRTTVAVVSPAIREAVTMPWLVKLLLALGVLGSLKGALSCLFSSKILSLAQSKVPAESFLSNLLQGMQDVPAWLMPVLGVLFLLNALFMCVVWNGQKWGVSALIVVVLAIVFVIANTNLGIVPALALGIPLALPVVALCLLLMKGGPRSLWNRME